MFNYRQLVVKQLKVYSTKNAKRLSFKIGEMPCAIVSGLYVRDLTAYYHYAQITSNVFAITMDTSESLIVISSWFSIESPENEKHVGIVNVGGVNCEAMFLWSITIWKLPIFQTAYNNRFIIPVIDNKAHRQFGNSAIVPINLIVCQVKVSIIV